MKYEKDEMVVERRKRPGRGGICVNSGVGVGVSDCNYSSVRYRGFRQI